MSNLKTTNISTPLGEMQAIATDSALVLLEFLDSENLNKNIAQLVEQFGEIEEAENLPLKQIKMEIEDYFKHPFTTFKTNLELIGTDFQKQVWEALLTIPAGSTTSYSEIAEKIGNENSARAVGNALNANKLTIIIPCHRVLTKEFDIGGYNGGQKRKSWLLRHEGI